MKEEVSDLEQNTAARRRPTWRPKPEEEVCINIQNPVYLQSSRLLTDILTLFFRDICQSRLLGTEGESETTVCGAAAEVL